MPPPHPQVPDGLDLDAEVYETIVTMAKYSSQSDGGEFEESIKGVLSRDDPRFGFLFNRGSKHHKFFRQLEAHYKARAVSAEEDDAEAEAAEAKVAEAEVKAAEAERELVETEAVEAEAEAAEAEAEEAESGVAEAKADAAGELTDDANVADADADNELVTVRVSVPPVPVPLASASSSSSSDETGGSRETAGENKGGELPASSSKSPQRKRRKVVVRRSNLRRSIRKGRKPVIFGNEPSQASNTAPFAAEAVSSARTGSISPAKATPATLSRVSSSLKKSAKRKVVVRPSSAPSVAPDEGRDQSAKKSKTRSDDEKTAPVIQSPPKKDSHKSVTGSPSKKDSHKYVSGFPPTKDSRESPRSTTWSESGRPKRGQYARAAKLGATRATMSRSLRVTQNKKEKEWRKRRRTTTRSMMSQQHVSSGSSHPPATSASFGGAVKLESFVADDPPLEFDACANPSDSDASDYSSLSRSPDTSPVSSPILPQRVPPPPVEAGSVRVDEHVFGVSTENGNRMSSSRSVESPSSHSNGGTIVRTRDDDHVDVDASGSAAQDEGVVIKLSSGKSKIVSDSRLMDIVRSSQTPRKNSNFVKKNSVRKSKKRKRFVGKLLSSPPAKMKDSVPDSEESPVSTSSSTTTSTRTATLSPKRQTSTSTGASASRSSDEGDVGTDVLSAYTIDGADIVSAPTIAVDASQPHRKDSSSSSIATAEAARVGSSSSPPSITSASRPAFTPPPPPPGPPPPLPQEKSSQGVSNVMGTSSRAVPKLRTQTQTQAPSASATTTASFSQPVPSMTTPGGVPVVTAVHTPAQRDALQVQRAEAARRGMLMRQQQHMLYQHQLQQRNLALVHSNSSKAYFAQQQALLIQHQQRERLFFQRQMTGAGARGPVPPPPPPTAFKAIPPPPSSSSVAATQQILLAKERERRAREIANERARQYMNASASSGGVVGALPHPHAVAYASAAYACRDGALYLKVQRMLGGVDGGAGEPDPKPRVITKPGSSAKNRAGRRNRLPRFGPSWIQCTECLKWRNVPTANALELEDKSSWTCEDSDWTSAINRRCSVPEDRDTSENIKSMSVSRDDTRPEYIRKKKRFYRKLLKHYFDRGQMKKLVKLAQKPPYMGGYQLDLYRVYKEVCARGGYDDVLLNEQWVVIFRGLKNFRSTNTGASNRLKGHYLFYLYGYERMYRQSRQGDWRDSVEDEVDSDDSADEVFLSDYDGEDDSDDDESGEGESEVRKPPPPPTSSSSSSKGAAQANAKATPTPIRVHPSRLPRKKRRGAGGGGGHESGDDTDSDDGGFELLTKTLTPTESATSSSSSSSTSSPPVSAGVAQPTPPIRRSPTPKSPPLPPELEAIVAAQAAASSSPRGESPTPPPEMSLVASSCGANAASSATSTSSSSSSSSSSKSAPPPPPPPPPPTTTPTSASLSMTTSSTSSSSTSTSKPRHMSQGDLAKKHAADMERKRLNAMSDPDSTNFDRLRMAKSEKEFYKAFRPDDAVKFAKERLNMYLKLSTKILGKKLKTRGKYVRKDPYATQHDENPRPVASPKDVRAWSAEELATWVTNIGTEFHAIAKEILTCDIRGAHICPDTYAAVAVGDDEDVDVARLERIIDFYLTYPKFGEPSSYLRVILEQLIRLGRADPNWKSDGNGVDLYVESLSSDEARRSDDLKHLAEEFGCPEEMVHQAWLRRRRIEKAKSLGRFRDDASATSFESRSHVGGGPHASPLSSASSSPIAAHVAHQSFAAPAIPMVPVRRAGAFVPPPPRTPPPSALVYPSSTVSARTSSFRPPPPPVRVGVPPPPPPPGRPPVSASSSSAGGFRKKSAGRIVGRTVDPNKAPNESSVNTRTGDKRGRSTSAGRASASGTDTETDGDDDYAAYKKQKVFAYADEDSPSVSSSSAAPAFARSLPSLTIGSSITSAETSSETTPQGSTSSQSSRVRVVQSTDNPTLTPQNGDSAAALTPQNGDSSRSPRGADSDSPHDMSDLDLDVPLMRKKRRRRATKKKSFSSNYVRSKKPRRDDADSPPRTSFDFDLDDSSSATKADDASAMTPEKSPAAPAESPPIFGSGLPEGMTAAQRALAYTSPSLKPSTSSSNIDNVNLSPSLTAREMCARFVGGLVKDEACELFVDKVNKQQEGLESYYDIVKSPMWLTRIATKLANGNYNTVEEVRSDLMLVWDNAMLFNAEDSYAYIEASRLRKKSERMLARIVQTLEEVGATTSLRAR